MSDSKPEPTKPTPNETNQGKQVGKPPAPGTTRVEFGGKPVSLKAVPPKDR